MKKKLNTLLKAARNNTSLVHAITNPISINQCANTILSAGAKPIMAEHPREVSSITKGADALLINLGNITDIRLKSIKRSVRTAEKHSIPWVLDLVGVACSPLRRNFANKLLKRNTPTVIKGNYSEIAALYSPMHKERGIDADVAPSEENITPMCIALARKYNTVILASGKCDIIASPKKLIKLRHGTPMLGRVTGTGCMLGALCAAYIALSKDIASVVLAAAVLCICGELADKNCGTATFMVNLMDEISNIYGFDNLNIEEENI